ncbi:NADP-dependent oxidoreductase domain-containing protein [Cyathus striatus]|nr:NADP-dependent oxidoreductase domain-containing protein [Cyathus striatus]
MSFGKILTLSSGASLPQISLGTWLSKPLEVMHAAKCAVHNGYCHLDLAMVCENQDEVGAALKKVTPSVVKHKELFITSKLWNSSHQLDETLRLLGLDYFDLYFIYWPVAFPLRNGLFPSHPTKENEVALDTWTSLIDTWKAMIKLLKSKVHNIGVFNFTIEHIKGIIKATGVIPVGMFPLRDRNCGNLTVSPQASWLYCHCSH